ncbi:UNVERIFIED_CONTAM: hypothetical protein NCL1_49482 [Trichonephila clavipes]
MGFLCVFEKEVEVTLVDKVVVVLLDVGEKQAPSMEFLQILEPLFVHNQAGVFLGEEVKHALLMEFSQILALDLVEILADEPLVGKEKFVKMKEILWISEMEVEPIPADNQVELLDVMKGIL